LEGRLQNDKLIGVILAQVQATNALVAFLFKKEFPDIPAELLQPFLPSDP
jgi:ABC-type glycerol-3-phosphate transport system permease component